MSTVKTEVKIRHMELKDIGAIFEIDRRLRGKERAFTHTDLSIQGLGEVLDLSDLSLVAQIGDRLIGFLLARHAHIGEPVMEAALIHSLGVDPNYSGRGVATKLVNSLFERCRTKGLKIVQVIISGRDSQMEGFFLHMDFRRAKLIVCERIL